MKPARKPSLKLSILAIVVSLLAIELAGFLLWKRRPRIATSPPSDPVTEVTPAVLRRAPRVALPPPPPAQVEGAVAAFAEPPPSDDPPADAAKKPLCGGVVCRPDQFCCGPAECGRCVSAMRGPRCPSTCL